MAANITEDDFLTWREHAVTRWVFAAINTASEAQKQAWVDASWINGSADPAALHELRTRADAYRALIDSTFADWSNVHEPADA